MLFRIIHTHAERTLNRSVLVPIPQGSVLIMNARLAPPGRRYVVFIFVTRIPTLTTYKVTSNVIWL